MRLRLAVTALSLGAVATLAVVSCSDTPTPAPTPSTDGVEWKAGTRLRPIFIGGGGVKRFSRFHDTLLDVDCTFQTMSDGRWRCAPGSETSWLFADAACTERLFALNETCAPVAIPKYVQDYTAGCTTTPDVFEVGAATTLTSFFTNDGSGCVATSSPSGQRYLTVTRTVAPAELVAAKVTRFPRGKQLVATYLDGEDGSRQPFGMEDRTAPHAGACHAWTAGDGELRCLPTLVATGGYYKNSACTVPAAYMPQGYSPDTCGPPLAVKTYVPSACGGALAFFEVGAELGGLYVKNPTTCDVAGISALAGAHSYLQGAPIADAAFARLTRTPGAETPLALETLVVDSGETVSVSSFWDAVHKLRCTPGIAGDGRRRCIPEASFIYAFADAACKTPIVTTDPRPANCAAPAPPAFGVWQDAMPPLCTVAPQHIFTVGALITPPPTQFYKLGFGGVCNAATPSPDSTSDYYATTTELPPSEMVELTETRE